jgi:hypothetical protein
MDLPKNMQIIFYHWNACNDFFIEYHVEEFPIDDALHFDISAKNGPIQNLSAL